MKAAVADDREEKQAEEYVGQAEALMGEGRFEAAALWAGKAIALSGNCAEGYRVLGDSLAAQSRFDEAKDAYQAVLSLKEKDPEIWFDLGICALMEDDLPGALEYYQKAEKNGYESRLLYTAMAEIYAGIGEMQLADRYFLRAVQQEPLHADARIGKAKYELSTGRPEKALRTLEELNRLMPLHREAVILHTEVLEALGEHEGAAAFLKRALEEDPGNALWMVRLAQILHEEGDTKQAEDWLDQAGRFMDPTDKNIILLRAQIALEECKKQNGEKEGLRKADEQLRLLCGENEKDEEVIYLRMLIAFTLENEEETLTLAEELAGSDNCSVYHISGCCLKAFIHNRQGKEQQARTEWKELSSRIRRETVKNPHFYEGYIYRILCHRQLGEEDQVRELTEYLKAAGFTDQDLAFMYDA